jgi:hypothetical protein
LQILNIFVTDQILNLMDKSQVKESILRMFEAELDAWLEIEPKIKDAFEYERDLLSRTLRIGQNMITLSQGEIPKDRNAKKKFTPHLDK